MNLLLNAPQLYRPIVLRPARSQFHFEEILRIERECFQFPWNPDDLRQYLSRPDVATVIAQPSGVEPLAGFLIWCRDEWNPPGSSVSIFNLAVDPRFRRQGIGRRMVTSLYRFLKPDLPSFIWVELRERNLAAQLFFRELQFQAVHTNYRPYQSEETDEDSYIMAHPPENASRFPERFCR